MPSDSGLRVVGEGDAWQGSALRWSRRAFLAGLASSAAAQGPARGAVDVRRFGAAGDGAQDDTAAFAAALRAAPVVRVPAGIYLVERIMVPAGRTLITDGFATVFRQRPGIGSDTRLLNVVGSDVRIGDCTVEGNIATDSGEQRHGIFVYATPDTGALSNITVGDVRGRNLRGDVVCIGGVDGHIAANVRVGFVRGDNVLRNVVSIVGGRDISIRQVAGSRVGLMHLDIEPDDGNGPLIGCSVGAVRGGFAQVAGSSPLSFVDQVRLGVVELTGPAGASVPEYKGSLARKHALTVRNYRSLGIRRLIVRGYQGAAVSQIWDPGALTDQKLHIATADLGDCSRDPQVARAYVVGSRRATRLTIDDLTIDRLRAGIDVVRDCREAHIGKVRGKLPKGSRLIAQSSSWLQNALQEAGPAPVIFAAPTPAAG